MSSTHVHFYTLLRASSNHCTIRIISFPMNTGLCIFGGYATYCPTFLVCILKTTNININNGTSMGNKCIPYPMFTYPMFTYPMFTYPMFTYPMFTYPMFTYPMFTYPMFMVITVFRKKYS